MNSTLTDSVLTETENSAFVPMTEAQMSSIRGGTDWPDWFVDMVGDFVQNAVDALEYLDTVLDPTPNDFDEEYWDDVELTLLEEGFAIPTGP